MTKNDKKELTNKTKLQLAKEMVRIYEENPSIDWSELMEEVEKWCKEMEGVIYEMD